MSNSDALPLEESPLALSDEEQEWCRHPLSSDGDAGLRLAAQVILAAVEDYRSLAERGMIVGGEIPADCVLGPMGHRRFKRPWLRYFREWEVLELIAFLQSDQLDRWLAYAHFNISGDRIREKLGLERK